MLEVTARARIELHGMLIHAVAQSQSADGTVAFRLVADEEGGSLGLMLDAPQDEDLIVEHEGSSILILDPSISDLLRDLKLDVVETPEGTGLGIRG